MTNKHVVRWQRLLRETTLQPFGDVAPNVGNPNAMIEQLIEYRTRFNMNLLKSPLNEGVMQALFSLYIVELWLGEFHPQQTIDTIKVVELLFQQRLDDMETLLQQSGLANYLRVKQKLINLLAACRYLLGHDMISYRDEPLSVDLIQRVHAIVGAEGMVENAGQFRTFQVTPSLTGRMIYAVHPQIPTRLKDLVQFVNDNLEQIRLLPQNADRYRRHFLLGVVFFSEFLRIHPFGNGNGRVARIIVNHFLREIVFVPFSLCYTNNEDDGPQKLYFKVLEARADLDSAPNKLALYMLMCANQSYRNLENEVDESVLALVTSPSEGSHN